MVVLEARNISFGYNKTASLLTEWSAQFFAGEVVAVTGASGRGKSTLLYLLGLMLSPTSGGVFLDGQAVHSLSDRARAHLRATRYGFVFQDAALDPTRSVLDNVLETTLYRGELPAGAIAVAKGLLEQFGVELRASAKPGQVSGGQAQRIALCRALLGAPDVLLADEPTGNLDSESTSVVLDAFHQHADSGATVVVVTHDPAVVERCTRKILL